MHHHKRLVEFVDLFDQTGLDLVQQIAQHHTRPDPTHTHITRPSAPATHATTKEEYEADLSAVAKSEQSVPVTSLIHAAAARSESLSSALTGSGFFGAGRDGAAGLAAADAGAAEGALVA
jgi:hypothetical protein